MVRGPDRACFLTKRRGYDPDRMAHRPPFESIELFTKWIKQRRTRLSNTATDDHDLGIESIYERSDRSREVMDGTKPDRRGLAVAAKMRFDQQACRGESTSRALSDVVVANHLLETSGRVYDVWTAI